MLYKSLIISGAAYSADEVQNCTMDSELAVFAVEFLNPENGWMDGWSDPKS